MRELLAENDRLTSELEVKENGTERVVKKLKDQESQMNRSAFVSVLIDGDGMNFLDELVKEGKDGGMKAASLLRQAVTEYIRVEVPDIPEDISVMIRVYANVEGLSKTYYAAKTLSRWGQFEDFVRGFNKGHALSDFIDAGDGKSRADHKLRTFIALHVDDPRCKFVIFGGCTDADYGSTFDPYINDEEVCSRLLLIESPPFTAQLKHYYKKLSTCRFNRVFRRDKIPQKGAPKRKEENFEMPTAQLQHPKTETTSPTAITYPLRQSLDPFIDNGRLMYGADAVPRLVDHTIEHPLTVSTQQPPSPTGGPNLDESLITARSAPTQSGPWTINIADTPQEGSKILTNSQGHRLDVQLNVNYANADIMVHRKLCRNYHLKGVCDYRATCTYSHEGTLDETGYMELWAATRRIKCLYGLGCRDEFCVYGHEYTIPRCNPQECYKKFPPEMHNVSRT